MTSMNIRPHPLFIDAFAKVQWAWAKTVELEVVLQSYNQSGMRWFVEEVNNQPTFFHVLTDPLNFPIALQVGDIVRNLRGSLDHVVSTVYRAHGLRDDTSHVRWHTATDRTNLESSVNVTLVKQ
jgi:hypothetical protein